jgi:hypothetical protein
LKTIKYILILLFLFTSFGYTNDSTGQNVIKVKQKEPIFYGGGELKGHRSRENVNMGMITSFNEMRRISYKTFIDTPQRKIKLIVKFKVDHVGTVISSEVIESNSNNPEFDSKIFKVINLTKFGRIKDVSDTSEVTYPLDFKFNLKLLEESRTKGKLLNKE